MDEKKLSVHALPMGLHTAAGGTRTQVKLSRPWQQDIMVDPSTCPFDTREQRVIKAYALGGGWRVLDNLYTPFPFHQLIIPNQCWPAEKLRVLGGEEELSAALTIALERMEHEQQEGYARNNDFLDRYILTAHIGPLAGQNLSHFHMHFIGPNFLHTSQHEAPTYLHKDADERKSEYQIRSNLDQRVCIYNDDRFIVGAGGHRAGQCYILPQNFGMNATPKNLEALAAVVLHIVRLYAERMKSEQGLPPEYMILLKFRHGTFRYGFYLPILNHWGATEYFGLLGEEPLILPWPHEETVRHLKGA